MGLKSHRGARSVRGSRALSGRSVASGDATPVCVCNAKRLVERSCGHARPHMRHGGARVPNEYEIEEGKAQQKRQPKAPARPRSPSVRVSPPAPRRCLPSPFPGDRGASAPRPPPRGGPRPRPFPFPRLFRVSFLSRFGFTRHCGAMNAFFRVLAPFTDSLSLSGGHPVV